MDLKWWKTIIIICSILLRLVLTDAPHWSKPVRQPKIYVAPRTDDQRFYINIIGQPQPSFSVQKFTSTGLEDLPITVDIEGSDEYFAMYFRTFTEESDGVYQIVANNSMGMFTTNITLRGPTLPPKNLRVWSTAPNCTHVEWTAGEIFDSSPTYYLYYKTEGESWSDHKLLFGIDSTINHTYNSLKPNRTYYFLVNANHESSLSVYSNMAMATTLNPGDPPQTKPPIYQTVKPTSTSSVTSMEPTLSISGETSMESTTSGETSMEQTTSDVTSTLRQGLSTSVAEPVKNKESELNGGKKDVLTFEVGIGIGIGIGLILVIIAVMGTVIYFQRSSVNNNYQIPDIDVATTTRL